MFVVRSSIPSGGCGCLLAGGQWLGGREADSRNGVSELFGEGAPGGLGPAAELIAAGGFLLLAMLLLLLARGDGAGGTKRVLAGSGAAALLLALAAALGAGGLGAPTLLVLARLAGFAALGWCLLRVLRRRAGAAPPGARAPEESGGPQACADAPGGAADAAGLQAQVQELQAQVAARKGELQACEARLDGFVRHVPAAIAFKGLDGRLLMVNRRAEAMLGMSASAALGPEALSPPELAARVREQDERVIERREELQLEQTLDLPDGSTRDYLTQKFPLVDASGHGWGLGVIATDITERKQAERADLQRRKLESLGLLAGGVAHDFNNLLGAMVGNLELFRSEQDPQGPGHARLQALEQLLERASSLVAQILAYTGKGKFQVQALNLNLQVEEMLRILQASLPRKPSLQWRPAPGLPLMEGDPGQIQQVIMNLVLNAAEAVAPEGGLIALKTWITDLTQAGIDKDYQGQALKPGPHLVLEVTDNGTGMTAGVKERIFDPFFTTKFTGRGLGLSAVQGILRGHQGGIQVQSREGEGTRFRVLFPASAVQRRVAASGPPDPEPEAVHRGTGTVLVVDDEAALRSVAVSALQRQGYDTLEAGDGLEALQVYEANRGIRLVLIDLTMPGMDGDEACRELRRAGAMVPIILCSGFGQDEAFQRFRGRGLAGFLPKPYRLQDLLQAVRYALEGRPDRSGLREYRPGQRVAWDRAFTSGHPLIDQQHQDLVRVFNQLVAVVEQGAGPKERDQALGRFIDATIAHFGVEEGLMAGFPYAQAREHQEVHARLAAQIQDLGRKLRTGEADLAMPTVNFLEDWLVCHIQSEDLHLARHLKTGGH